MQKVLMQQSATQCNLKFTVFSQKKANSLLITIFFFVFAEKKLERPTSRIFRAVPDGGAGGPRQTYFFVRTTQNRTTRTQRTSSNGHPATPAAAELTAVPSSLSQDNQTVAASCSNCNNKQQQQQAASFLQLSILRQTVLAMCC